jgi:TrpR family transcriptional regulator, trp operon repressor
MKLERDNWHGFIDLCCETAKKDGLERFFDLFFTIEEKETFAARFLIIQALLEGKLTQREIAEKYHVSIAQITRGSNALKIIDPKLKTFLTRSLT